VSREWTVFEKRLLGGAGLWLLFCVVAVALRGVRWEETYEHALMITGNVPYPDGHPSYVYARNVFSLQSYASALLLSLVDSPLLINGLRNLLHLCFTTIPVFLMGAWCTGSVRWGHAAAVLVLVGVHQDFQSYYPMVPWPNMYGIGQIGMGCALLALSLIIAGKARAAGFLLGLMVAVHIGQLPVVLAVALLAAAWHYRQGGLALIRTGAAGFCAGLAVSLVFLVVQQFLFKVPLPSAPPYGAEGDVHAIWHGYSSLYDIHRFFPRFNPFAHSLILMFAALLFGAEAAWREYRSQGRPGTFALIFAYILIVCLTVWVSMALHRAMGDQVPFLLLGWMPYRLTNHLAPILLVLVLSLFADGAGVNPRWRGAVVVLVLAMLLGALVPFLKDRMRDDGYESFIENPVPIFYLLAGAAAMLAAGRSSGGRWGIGLGVILALTTWIALDRQLGTTPLFARTLEVGVCVVLPLLLGVVFRKGALPSLLTGLAVGLPFLALASYHQFGTAFVAIGAILSGVGYLVCGLRPPRFAMPAALFALLLLLPLAALLDREYRFREHLPLSEFQQRVKSYLAEKGEEDALLVPPYWDIEWLSRTRHPIMSDYQTAHHMTYMPALAPSIKKMHEEVYADPIDRADEDGQLNVWRERTLGEWRELGAAYGFRYIIAPEWVAPDLPKVIELEHEGLYRIPDASE
jgi:hypothetical protein